jgi:branched-chain amino acid transport system permease protein
MDHQIFFQFLLPGITTGCVYALVALGFVLVLNVSGVINMAQGEFVMLGGVVAAWLLDNHVSLGVAVLAAALLGGVLGAAQERLTLAPVRSSPIFIQATITIGVAAVLRGLALIIFGKDPYSMPGFTGDGVFTLFGAFLPVQTLWVWGATVLLLAAIFAFLKYTNSGRAVRACSINLQAARLMGVNAERLTLVVFAATGAIAAIAGIVITPIVLASWDAGVAYSVKGFIGAILGGFKSPTIAVLGGLGIGIVEALGAGYISSGWKDGIVYAVMLVYLLIRGGVFVRGRAGLLSGSH